MIEKFSDEWYKKIEDKNSPEWKEYREAILDSDIIIGNQDEYKHLKDQQHRKTA